MRQYRTWLLVLSVMLQGCATLSPDPCRRNDWYAIGYEEGLAGRVSGPADGPEQSCHGDLAEPELSEYRRGRDAGLGKFCEPQNGFELGVAGDRYNGACRGAIEAPFLRAYHNGKRVHDVEAQIRRLVAILAVNESERDSLGERIRQKQSELAQGPAAVDGRAEAHSDLRELKETIAMVETEIDAIEAALREERAQLMLLMQNDARWEQDSR